MFCPFAHCCFESRGTADNRQMRSWHARLQWVAGPGRWPEGSWWKAADFDVIMITHAEIMVLVE